MAYTIQTVILFGGLGLVKYNDQITSATGAINATTKTAIGIIAFAIPPLLMLLSLIVFSKKYALHGKLADEVHEYILNARSDKINS